MAAGGRLNINLDEDYNASEMFASNAQKRSSIVNSSSYMSEVIGGTKIKQSKSQQRI